MKLSKSFWKGFELDIQELRLSYIDWALRCLKEPPSKYRHLFLWEEHKSLFVINSRYGRCFSISPFGLGVRGVPKERLSKCRAGLDDHNLALIEKINVNTRKIRDIIKTSLREGNVSDAKDSVTTFYFLKLWAHEVITDQCYIKTAKNGEQVRSKFKLDESEKWDTLNGIRNHVINSVRYFEDLEDECVKLMDCKLPGFTHGTKSTFVNGGLNLRRFALCSMDFGPIIFSRSEFVDYKLVKRLFNEVQFPQRGDPIEILRPYFRIVLYRDPPLCVKGKYKSYSLKSMRKRSCELFEFIDRIMDEINESRKKIK